MGRKCVSHLRTIAKEVSLNNAKKARILSGKFNLASPPVVKGTCKLKREVRNSEKIYCRLFLNIFIIKDRNRAPHNGVVTKTLIFFLIRVTRK